MGNSQSGNDAVLVVVIPTVLTVFLVVLGAGLAIVLVLVVRKRRLWCFARPERVTKPIAIRTTAEQEAKMKRNKRLRGMKHNRKIGFNILSERRQSLRRKHGLLRDQDNDIDVANPLQTGNDELDTDFTNPVFDAEGARARDAALCIQAWWRMYRYRVLFLQLREAVILAQAMWRGKKCRKLFPELKRRKTQEQQRKKSIGVFNKRRRLATLLFYDVKGFGFAEVEQLYGLETIREATNQLKKMYGGKGKMRLKILISVHGVKLFDAYTLAQYAAVNISSISFCTMDPKNKRIFAFINRKKRRNFCHVFQCNEGDALKLVETMAEAFESTFKQTENMMGSQQVIPGSQGARQVAEIPRGMYGSQMSIQTNSQNTLATVGGGGSNMTKPSPLVRQGAVDTPRGPPQSIILEENSHGTDFKGSPATGRARRSNQPRNMSKLAKERKAMPPLLANEEVPQPAEDYLGDLQKAMDDLRIMST